MIPLYNHAKHYYIQGGIGERKRVDISKYKISGINFDF